MNNTLKDITRKIKLTDTDKKVIRKNSGVCTDLHGKGCTPVTLNSNLRNVN